MSLLVGLFLLPLGWGAVHALLQQLAEVREVPSAWSPFVSGLVVYLVIHTIFYKPEQLYETGRETVDAAVTKTVGNGAGKSHPLTILSRLIPFYVVLVVIGFFVYRTFWGVTFLDLTAVFLLGLTIGMHWLMTIDTMKENYESLIKSYYITSVVGLTIWMCIMSATCLAILFRGPSFSGFVVGLCRESASAYYLVISQLFA